MNLLFSLLPIIVLIWLMTKNPPVASYIALPLIGLSCYLIQILWFKTNFILVNAHLLSAVLLTLTPISIIAGAILLNGLMQRLLFLF